MPGRPEFRKKIIVQEAKARTYCRRCGKKGHWIRKCLELANGKENAFQANWAYIGLSGGSMLLRFLITIRFNIIFFIILHAWRTIVRIS